MNAPPWIPPRVWSSPPPGFAPVSWEAPLDTDATLSRVPDDATTRGVNFMAILDAAEAARVPLKTLAETRIYAFKTYPMRLLVRLLIEAADVLHPNLSTRRALRQLGWLIYPRFLNSIVGRVTFSLVKREVLTVFRRAGDVYKTMLNHGRVSCLHAEPGFAVFRFEGLHNFPDAYHLGVLEGALRFCQHPHTAWLQPNPLDPAVVAAATWHAS